MPAIRGATGRYQVMPRHRRMQRLPGRSCTWRGRHDRVAPTPLRPGFRPGSAATPGRPPDPRSWTPRRCRRRRRPASGHGLTRRGHPAPRRDRRRRRGCAADRLSAIPELPKTVRSVVRPSFPLMPESRVPLKVLVRMSFPARPSTRSKSANVTRTSSYRVPIIVMTNSARHLLPTSPDRCPNSAAKNAAAS